MSRFYCSSCGKKRELKFEAIRVNLFTHESRVCVSCWEDVFKCDKSNLVRVRFHYKNILENKKERPLQKTLE